MSTIATIKAAHLASRKERNAVNAALYSTLLGDIQIVGKNNGNRDTTDSEAMAVIKKFIANAKETYAVAPTDGGKNEITLLEALLPQQLNQEALSNIVTNLVAANNATTIKDLGRIMKLLKEQYDGQYDGTLASKLIKERLNAVTV